MVKYVDARYVGGENTDVYYQHGKVYPLAIRVSFFRKKVALYKRVGYLDNMQPGTLREFRDLDSMDKIFKVIKEQ